MTIQTPIRRWPAVSLSLALSLAVSLTGCESSPLSVSAMVAPLTSPTNTVAQHLTVGSLVVEKPTNWNHGDEEFREALLESLQRSHLFKTVSAQGPARWVLHADIVQQVYNPFAELMIRYTIKDATEERVIWATTVYSSSAGAATKRSPIETAVRDNIGEALRRLQRWLASIGTDRQPTKW